MGRAGTNQRTIWFKMLGQCQNSAQRDPFPVPGYNKDFSEMGVSGTIGGVLFSLEKSNISRFFKLDNFEKW